jgi:hypothetical protein
MWRIEGWKQNPVAAQREVLQDLVTSAQYTEFGRKYQFSSLYNIRSFKKAIPIHEYDDLKPYILRLMEGEQNLLWNTPINWFAKSSGTTSEKSKFIPVSNESLEDGHYRAAKDVVTMYYHFNPFSDLLTGKGLVIGGSHTVNRLNDETHYYADAQFFNSFAKPIYFINTARGKNTDTAALVEALKNGQVRGACLDVIEYEKASLEGLEKDPSLTPMRDLIAMPNVVLTPHIAGWTHESYEKLSSVLADKILGED